MSGIEFDLRAVHIGLSSDDVLPGGADSSIGAVEPLLGLRILILSGGYLRLRNANIVLSGLQCCDLRIRIRQELLLGVGGLRALKALGISPGVFHPSGLSVHKGLERFDPIEDSLKLHPVVAPGEMVSV